MPEVVQTISGTESAENCGYCLISPRQFYARINRDLDEPIGMNTVYQLVKQAGFPSVKIGGRFYVIENKVDEWLQGLTDKRQR